MKTKRTMSSWKLKSIRKEVRSRSIRLLLLLAMATIASWSWAPNAGAVVKTYHTDSGGDWTCGSAVVGMTGILTDESTYTCATDSLSFTSSDTLIGTWIMAASYPQATTITGQNLYFYINSATYANYVLDFELGYWTGGTFTALGSNAFQYSDVTPPVGEYVVDLSSISGVIPAGTSLSLRLTMSFPWGWGDGTLSFGNAISPAGYIRFGIVENSPPTVSLISDQSTYVNNPREVALTISDKETASDDLVVTTTSDNQALLPDSNIVLEGRGDHRTVTLTPVTDQTGSALVTIEVSDGEQLTTEYFTVAWSIPLRVPADSPDLLSAVGAVADGGIILLQDGVYTGDNNKNIILDGSIKNITITSENGPENTVIDLGYSGRAFTFQGGSISTLDGFKIINGNISTDNGGAISVVSVPAGLANSPVITNCEFVNNNAVSGGAIYVELDRSISETPAITNCTFSKNFSQMFGGAIAVGVSNSGDGFFQIADCAFSYNKSGSGGGAIVVSGTPNTVTAVVVFFRKHSF